MKKRKLTPFGLKVKNRLVDLNMSQKELAKNLGTSDVYLSMILYGERSGNMYLDDIKAILDMRVDNNQPFTSLYPSVENS